MTGEPGVPVEQTPGPFWWRIRRRLKTVGWECLGVGAVLTVGLLLGGLLLGYEPVGGDPDRIFRPIKAELARSLREGALPFWSERFGLGIPLVAESHVAAFYPPNWLLYRVLDVSNAYRLSMWLHHMALAAATFAYARRIGIQPWGAAAAAVSFPFCGFLTVHSSHEWAYHNLVYLPLCLLAADHYAMSGRKAWLGLLAMLWGVQLALGHFQVQMWTGGLTLLTGGWRVVADRRPLGRLLGLALALGWSGAVAAVQLGPSWELARVGRQTVRSISELMFYSYPPSHLAELAIPGLFRGLQGGPEAAYWFTEQTTGFEACLFVGTVPLILAWIGLVGGGRGLTPWRLIVPASLALATMPRWWPEGYMMVLRVPLLGFFRCPARYTAITSLGLCLLAGRGLDRAVSSGRFRAGLILAVAFGAMAMAWAAALPFTRPEFRRCLDDAQLMGRLGLAGLTWAIGLGAIVFWRRGTRGALLPLLLIALEMGAFYHLGGTTHWGWSVSLPESSPVLKQLAREPGVRRVGGAIDNLPVRAGLTTATPYTGFRLPPPTPLLNGVQDRRAIGDPAAARWLRRYGVTHQVWDFNVPASTGEVVFLGPDPALDVLAYRSPGMPDRRSWRIVRVPDPFPEVRVALRARVAPDRPRLIDALSRSDSADEAWYLEGESPAEPTGPRAGAARVVSWAGLSGEVEHDGVCDLVVTRAYYPGWWVQVDDGPERPASSADGGLLAVRLEPRSPGSLKTSRVTFRYRSNGAGLAALVSAIAVAAAVIVASRLVWGTRPSKASDETR
jgi:hypothetical protein